MKSCIRTRHGRRPLYIQAATDLPRLPLPEGPPRDLFWPVAGTVTVVGLLLAAIVPLLALLAGCPEPRKAPPPTLGPPRDQAPPPTEDRRLPRVSVAKTPHPRGLSLGERPDRRGAP